MKKIFFVTLVLFFGAFCINAQPIANFEVDVTDGCSPVVVNFDASSSLGDIVSYKWNFYTAGNFPYGEYEGADPTVSKTFFAYPGSGIAYYRVVLMVTDADGLTAFHSVSNLVTARPVSNPNHLTPTICQGESIVLNGTTYDESNPSGSEILPNFAGCDSLVQINVTFATEMELVNTLVQNVPYQQTSGGSIYFDVLCGTEPYTYDWSPAMTGVENEATDLVAGTYSVTVTDLNNNTATSSFEVSDSGPLGLDILSINDPACFGEFGSLNFQINGGAPPYMIIVDGIVQGGFFFNTIHSVGRPAGTYEFGIVDDNGVEDFFPNPITFENQTTAPFEVTATGPGDVTICSGESVTLEVLAPDAIFYNWDPASSVDCPTCATTLATPLGTTTYTYSVEDPYGCVIEDTMNVMVIEDYTLINSTLCVGESITVNGNVYDETTPSGIETLQGTLGCDSTVQVMLNFTTQMEIINTVVENVPPQQSSGGSISFDISCGVPPFTYIWTPDLPGVENMATNLTAGTYTVSVVDNLEDTITESFQITASSDPTYLELYDVTVNSSPTCPGGFFSDGCVQLDWVGGVPPYTIRRFGSGSTNQWVGGAITGNTFQNCSQTDGTYHYYIEDTNGLKDTFPNLITIVADNPAPEVSIPSGDLSACRGDTVLLEALAPTATSFQWFFWGGGTIDCEICPSTELALDNFSSDAVIEVQDANGCWNWDTIYVEVINCDKVWPGDTDTSNVVDNYDLINIGLAFDSVGPVRPNASLGWFGQEADPWLQNINGNQANFKHSDTDGNGIVNADDTLAISLNWGQIHNFTGNPQPQLIPSYPPTASSSGVSMPFYVEPDTFLQGETVNLSVILGEEGAPAEDVYGIAFSLEYDPALIVPGSAYLAFENSWAGSIGQNMISIQKGFTGPGRIDVALTRVDHTNMTGFGQVAELFITIEDDILLMGNPEIESILTEDALFNITNVVAINKDGEGLETITMETTSLIEGLTSGIDNANLERQVKVFPNPVNDQLFVNTSGLIIEELEVFSVTGVLLESKKVQSNSAEVSTANLKDGVYIVRVGTEGGVVNKRIMVIH